MHIGLIGGIGPVATSFYYEQIAKAYAAAEQQLDLTIAHTSALTLSRNVAAGRALEQAAEYQRVAKQLSAAGAEVIAITSMGGHFCAQEFAPISPRPLIDGPSAVGAHLRELGLRRVGVLGTRIVMQTGLYGALATLEVVVPPGDELAQANDDYIDMAVAGAATVEQRERLLLAGRKLVRDHGAECVLLGGTDLNLVYGNACLDFPVIDSAAIHAAAIVQATLNGSA
jgi:aspartate racemase